MKIYDFKNGELVIITDVDDALRDQLIVENVDINKMVGTICEVRKDSISGVLLDRAELPNGRCVLNDMWAKHATLRLATDREKFLYTIYNIERVE